MKYGLMILIWCVSIYTPMCVAEDKILLEKIEVTLNSTKNNGRSWDAFKNAPDIALCVVTATDDHCYLRVGSQGDSSPKIKNPLFQGKKYSFCQNSYDCKFEVNKPFKEVLGLVILELDTKNTDFVDAAIITSKVEDRLSDEIKNMDERLRNISYKYSQVFSEAEKQRRLKKIPVCKISTDNSSECKLKQSRIKIN